jgi:hypothetical protein
MGTYSKWECGSGGRGRRARGAASVWGPRARGPPRLSGDSQAERWGRGSGGERTGGFQRTVLKFCRLGASRPLWRPRVGTGRYEKAAELFHWYVGLFNGERKLGPRVISSVWCRASRTGVLLSCLVLQYIYVVLLYYIDSLLSLTGGPAPGRRITCMYK